MIGFYQWLRKYLKMSEVDKENKSPETPEDKPLSELSNFERKQAEFLRYQMQVEHHQQLVQREKEKEI